METIPDQESCSENEDKINSDEEEEKDMTEKRFDWIQYRSGLSTVQEPSYNIQSPPILGTSM